ncbi:MAG TPA: bifunctional folylpolyglutamate synthase/dihydrofolate synthase, partial [Elusimicrobia bacterium]|nr:bifunctional folylpolyglutamate synthase/dihydrofolate synthase [Elusimicrobiota bacterium]
FDYEGIFNNYRNLRIKLLGEHQVENACLAVTTIEVLRLKNIFISERAIRKGLENTFWPGRLEVQQLTVNGKRLTVILDGAHNPAGMKILQDNLAQLKTKRIFAILGILADKDISKMVKEICSVIDEVVVTKPTYYRGADPKV